MKTSNRQMRGGSSGMHPERRITLDSIRCDNLPCHPLSVKIYGAPKPNKKLLDSIEKVGLLQPLIVNDYGDGSYELLSGNTRAEAWRILLKQKKIKSAWIPCRFVQISTLDAERLVIESNRQREKTPEQKAREFTELKRIETELARQRQGARTDIKEKFPECSKGQARDKAAEAVGMSGRTAEKLEDIVEKSDSGDKKAKELLQQINLGEKSVSRAHQEVSKPKKTQQQVDAGVKQAKELSNLFTDGEVTRSKCDGLFHLLIRNLTADHIKKFSKML